ncbi:MAG: HD domain-containing protein [Lachnospiraceae bacterium]|nr:HD domain-containing protein [Lachnospiraceae bacterium]
MKDTIIIADADDDIREILEEQFSDNYVVISSGDGFEACNKAMELKDRLAGIVINADTPSMSGVDVTAKLKADPDFENVPIIILSSDASLKNEKAAYNAGATDFNKIPFDSALLKKKMLKYLDLFSVRDQLKAAQSKSSVNEDTSEAPLYKKMHDNMIELIGRIIEMRNPENENHLRRLKGLVKIMARKVQELYPEYGLTEEKINIIVTAVSLHNIGMTAIPDSVLLKPGRLTNEEYEFMKSHPLRGVEILDTIKGTWSKEYDDVIRKAIRSHHEKYDGGGYPDGLKGDDIPIEAQLISIADTYDALVNDRVYKKAYPKDVAANMINVGDCGVFPPKMLEVFKSTRADLEKWEESDLDLRKL